MSLSFKVTLIKEDEQETRRFVLTEDTASRFSDLQQKINSIFPALDQREPVVSWLDDEGDEVRMANDEELKLALTAMPGPVVKLRVRLGGKKEAEQQAGELHPGIVCDGCDGPVLGPRYKCLACADYDLCKNCEGRGLHSQHKMVRLPQPCKRDTRGLVRCPLMRASSSAFNNQAMGIPGVFAELLATRPWAKGCQMMPTATATEKPADKTEPKESSEAKNEGPGTKTENQAEGETSKTATSSFDNPSSLPGLLADLTPMLGPIQAEQLSQLLTTFQGSQLQEQLPQLGGLISTFLGPAVLEAVFPVLEALAKTQSVQSEAQQESEPEQKKTKEGSLEEEKASENSEAEKEKWDAMDVQNPDEEKTDSDFEMIPPSSTRSSIYPTLPTEEQARLWKTNPLDTTNHEDKEGTESVTNADKKMSKQDDTEDPKVAGALAQMQAMGFSDDGGWLSNLLKAKSGDVGKVLDAIQPKGQQ